MKPLFFCDLDGVLRNLISGVAAVAGAIYTDTLHESITRWDTVLYGKPFSEWIQDPRVFLASKPYPGAYEFVLELKEKGFAVYILTSQIFRPEILRAQISWLFANGFLDLVDGVMIVKGPDDKIRFLEGDNYRFLLDDHPVLTEEHNFKTDGFLSMERPWNPNGVFREFEEVVNYVEYATL